MSEDLFKTLQNCNYPAPTVTVDCAEGDKLQAILTVTEALGVTNAEKLTASLTDVASCENI